MELTAAQLVYIGIAAMCIVQAFKLASAKIAGFRPTKTQISWVCASVSFILAGVFVWPTLTIALKLDDPMAVVNSLISVATSVFGVATFVYVALAQKVLDKLNWNLPATGAGGDKIGLFSLDDGD